MSLLMEALKKAEIAKRKSNEGTEDAPPAASTPPAAIAAAPLTLAPADPRPARAEPEPAAPVIPTHAASATDASLRQREFAAPAPPPAIAESRPAPSLAADDAPKAAAAAATTRASAPERSPANADTNAPPAAKPAAPAPGLAARVRKTTAVWIGVVAIVVLLLGAGGIFYYDAMHDYLGAQTPMAESLAVTPEPVAPAAAVTVSALPVPAPAKPRKPVPGKPKADTPAPVVAMTSARDLTQAPVPPPPADQPVTVEAPAPPGTPAQNINVNREMEKNAVYALLQQAYAAYQSNDDGRAQVLYARVLGHEENNRDALLGLAAVAVRNRDFTRAQDIYSELLTLDPRDSVAQAGFVGVTGSLDPLLREARIKTLLDQEPNAPHLQFTYASLLMQQQRWAEAARVLQTAHQTQRDNPDYAFNLAVSLDHLGQNTTALQYYQLALTLAGSRSASFPPDDVRRRIESLRPAGEGVP